MSSVIGNRYLARIWASQKAMAAHSSTLTWKIPWMEEPVRLQSMGSQRVGHDWVTSLFSFYSSFWRRKWQPTPVFLPGESHGCKGLVGYSLWGCKESDTTKQLTHTHRWSSGKKSTCQCRCLKWHRFNPWVRKIPWRRKWQPTAIFLSGKSNGQRNLVDYSPWGHKESGMTEQLNAHTHTHTHTHTHLAWIFLTWKSLFSHERKYWCRDSVPGLGSFCHIVVVQSLNCVQLFVTPWTAASQASLPSTISRSLLMSVESVMPSNYLILCCSLFLLPSVWVGKIPWRRERLSTPVFWSGEFHGKSMRSQIVGHNWVTFTFIL